MRQRPSRTILFMLITLGLLSLLEGPPLEILVSCLMNAGNNMQLLITKSLKKHSRICILMKMKVELLLLVTESETESGLDEDEDGAAAGGGD